MPNTLDLKKCISTYFDFPKKGVNFYDITDLFKDPDIFALTTVRLTKLIASLQPDRLFAIDSKGFLFASPIALNLGIGLSLIRKKSKLPGNVKTCQYALEYGFDEIEARSEDFYPNERLVIIDDVLATGGTLAASIDLLQQLEGNVVGAITVLEIGNLKGKEKLSVPFKSLMYFPS